MTIIALCCSKKLSGLSVLLRGRASKYYGDFCSINCIHCYRTKHRLKSHKKVCKNKYFLNILMPSEDNKILELTKH